MEVEPTNHLAEEVVAHAVVYQRLTQEVLYLRICIHTDAAYLHPTLQVGTVVSVPTEEFALRKVGALPESQVAYQGVRGVQTVDVVAIELYLPTDVPRDGILVQRGETAEVTPQLYAVLKLRRQSCQCLLACLVVYEVLPTILPRGPSPSRDVVGEIGVAVLRDVQSRKTGDLPHIGRILIIGQRLVHVCQEVRRCTDIVLHHYDAVVQTEYLRYSFGDVTLQVVVLGTFYDVYLVESLYGVQIVTQGLHPGCGSLILGTIGENIKNGMLSPLVAEEVFNRCAGYVKSVVNKECYGSVYILIGIKHESAVFRL